MIPTKRCIVITLTLPQTSKAGIWDDGVMQYGLYVYQLFKKTEGLEQVFFLDTAGANHNSSFTVLGQSYSLMSLADAAAYADVIIELGAYVSLDLASVVQARGGKVVAFRPGNTMMDVVLGVFSQGEPLLPFSSVRYDQVWVLPQAEHHSGPMLQTLLQCPFRVAPFLWEPQFLESFQQQMGYGLFQYQVGKTHKTVAICEPTNHPSHTYHLPILVCEEAWQHKGDLPLVHTHVIGGYKHAGNPSLLAFVNHLQIFRTGHLSFENPIDLVQLMSQVADIVVSHHWESGLSAQYFDILYGGFPLIHNSLFFKDYGYYYPDFDVQAGGKQLLKAVAEHDQAYPYYLQKARFLLGQYSTIYPRNQSVFAELVAGLFAS